MLFSLDGFFTLACGTLAGILHLYARTTALSFYILSSSSHRRVLFPEEVHEMVSPTFTSYSVFPARTSMYDFLLSGILLETHSACRSTRGSLYTIR